MADCSAEHELKIRPVNVDQAIQPGEFQAIFRPLPAGVFGYLHIMRSLLPLVLFLSASLCVQAALVEKLVGYSHEGKTMEGFHVYDDAVTGKRPGVLVIHQWTGLGDYEKMRSRLLAEMGYNVLAADIYGQGIRPAPPGAGQEAGKYKEDRALFRGRMAAALDVLKGDGRTDSAKVAAIGYCFGGMGVLELARSGASLAGVISFHGSLDAAAGMEAQSGAVNAKVMVLHGAVDPYVPAEQVSGFQKEMEGAKVDWQMVSYGGAVHGFTMKGAGTEPSKGVAYNESADKRSWEAMIVFLAEIF